MLSVMLKMLYRSSSQLVAGEYFSLAEISSAILSLAIELVMRVCSKEMTKPPFGAGSHCPHNHHRLSSMRHPHLKYSGSVVRVFYCAYMVAVALLMVPIHAVTFLSKNRRPRATWSLTQAVSVKFLQRMHRMTELSNLSFHVKDPFSFGRHGKHTHFKFVPTLPIEKQIGVLNVDGHDMHARVGTYIWPRHRNDKRYDERDDAGLESGTLPLVGIAIHGGAYVHMSADESCSTSVIPKRLMQSGSFLEIHSVEYRLIHHSAFPGALLDVASVFDNLINERKVPPSRIVIIGDSAGGNLALSLARFIRDERLKDTPAGLLLLSPWCDPSFSYPFDPSAQRRRPNAGVDYLMDTPVPRAIIIKSFIGCTAGNGQGE